jgi:hypothetical protein
MNTKLTLSVDKSIIDEAKKYAKEQHVSLSKLIETYLSVLIRKESKDDLEILPELKNIGFDINLDENLSFKEDYGNHLSKKHS